MTARAEQRVRHRRKVTRRRALIGGTAALGITGAAILTTSLLSSAGAGTLTVTGFQVENFGKLVRSCGNCKTQYKRTIVLSDIGVTAPGKAIVGVNANYGDTATLKKIRIHGDTEGRLRHGCLLLPGDTPQYNVLKIDIVSGSTGSACLSPGTSFDCVDLLA
ncbi:pectate lyase [Streptomyces yaanensis]|uniref:Pectate lyase n=1 Tax=Streptomyces yaanensis TaxID=1142239 RepID=A0ABV7SHM9_9ACTN|nr:pectate lyase [Streptomyces sp. CGMCC 4.7035]WNC01124.1 pectate lyase [Streptomyces sp. CGMCC 4.7035]